jgi:hypothetical protein
VVPGSVGGLLLVLNFKFTWCCLGEVWLAVTGCGIGVDWVLCTCKVRRGELVWLFGYYVFS